MVIYLIIFFAKILEVSLMTIRTVLITKGIKGLASFISFFEVVIWIYLVGTVLVGIEDDPYRMLVYAAGYSCGIFVGSVMEERLGIGLITIHVIANVADGMQIAMKLREHGAAVTNLKGEGRDAGKSVLMIHIKRRKKNEILKVIKDTNPNVFISVYDVKNLAGGYGLKK